MTGQEAVDLIHQEAWTGRKPGLSRTAALLKKVGDPRSEEHTSELQSPS